MIDLSKIIIEAKDDRIEKIKEIIIPLFDYKFQDCKKEFMSRAGMGSHIKITENKEENIIKIDCVFERISFNLPDEAKEIRYVCSPKASGLFFEYNSQKYVIKRTR